LTLFSVLGLASTITGYGHQPELLLVNSIALTGMAGLAIFSFVRLQWYTGIATGFRRVDTCEENCRAQGIAGRP
jgi:hypothetical protein